MSETKLNFKRQIGSEECWSTDRVVSDWTSALSTGTHGFTQLKHKLLQEQLAQETDPELRLWLERAADESAAVAWTTPYPLLVWPELLEEASRTARDRVERQRVIRERTRPHQVLAA